MIGVKYPGLNDLHDGIALGACVVVDRVLCCGPILICEDEVKVLCFDRLKELGLEALGQMHVRHDRLYDIAARISDLCVAVEDCAVLGDGVSLALVFKSRCATGHSLEDRVLEAERYFGTGFRGCDDVKSRNSDQLTAVFAVNAVEVLSFLDDGVGRAAGLKSRGVLLGRHNEFGLRDGGELGAFRTGIAVFRVLLDRCVLLLLLVVAVEQLVLFVRSDRAADETEHEHESKDNKACDGHSVP